MSVAFAVKVTEFALVRQQKNQDCLKILTKGQEAVFNGPQGLQNESTADTGKAKNQLKNIISQPSMEIPNVHCRELQRGC